MRTRTSMRSVWGAAVIAVLAMGGVAACHDSTSPTPQVAKVVVSAPASLIEIGETVQLSAVAQDASGTTLERTVTWTSSDLTKATVSTTGVVTAIASGTVTITATAGGKTGTTDITVDIPVASLAVSVPPVELEAGDTVRATATVKDAAGNAFAHAVQWQTSDSKVVTVSPEGLVTAVGPGTATITIGAHAKSAALEVTVLESVGSVVIGGAASEPLEIGLTRQLTAYALDAANKPITRTITWSSSNEAFATVDQAGLVTGVARGTAIITATAGGKNASASVRVVGSTEGGETTIANNLSYPVIFVDGVGVGAADLSTGAGLRPLSTEGIPVDKLPFWWSSNAPDFASFYLQGGPNVWQAEWKDGSTEALRSAQVEWSDNLMRTSGLNTHSNIHVEVALYDYTGPQLTAYEMASVYGTGESEVMGATGRTYLATPTIFSVSPRMIIEKLNDSHEPVFTVLNQAFADNIVSTEGESGGSESGSTMKFGAEINGAGKIVYGYNLMVKNFTLPSDIVKFGWYRITFVLDDQSMVNGRAMSRHMGLGALAGNAEGEDGGSGGTKPVPQIDPGRNISWIDIYIPSASGGSE